MASRVNHLNVEEGREKRKYLSTFKVQAERFIPITGWLYRYKWKEDLMGDVMAGLTIGCLHVPQGLAFATLAKADPVFGLYTSCFSVLIYCIFGTAVISSFGPVAMASILTGEAVTNFSDSGFTNNQLVITITFLVGVYYLVGYLLRFAVITKLFTKPLTSSFLLACSMQIVTKSIKNVLDIKISEERGYFNAMLNLYNTVIKLPETNLVTLAISIVVLTILVMNKFLLQPMLKKKTSFILPMEMIVMILTTALSYFLNLREKNVTLLGSVPTGFPQVELPQFKAMTLLWIQALVIAVVNLSTTVSMTIMFNNDLRLSQELLAMAISNIVCSSLNTLPFGNSMMRTVVAQSCGIKTLLASVVSCIFVLMVILFMSPLFSTLPMCVLGCIIIYGLSILIVSKIKDIPSVFKSGYENIMIWTVTFLVSIIFTVQLGLLVGIIFTSRQFLAKASPADNNVSNVQGSSQRGNPVASRPTPEQERLLEMNKNKRNTKNPKIV